MQNLQYFVWAPLPKKLLISGQNQSQDLRKTRPIILNRSQPPPTLPDPFYIDFTFLNFFFEKKCFFFLKYFVYSHYFLSS